MYGLVMSEKLSQQDWLDHGFKVLRSEGHVGLKADRMVKKLGVSRGSFYWHFKSLDDFFAALLEAWKKQVTQTAMRELQSIPDGKSQLTEVIHRVLTKPDRLEAAMRSWGQVNTEVLQAVARADELRANYLAHAMEQQGVGSDVARSRASFLTWAHAGRAFSADQSWKATRDIAHDLASVFASKS